MVFAFAGDSTISKFCCVVSMVGALTFLENVFFVDQRAEELLVQFFFVGIGT